MSNAVPPTLIDPEKSDRENITRLAEEVSILRGLAQAQGETIDLLNERLSKVEQSTNFLGVSGMGRK